MDKNLLEKFIEAVVEFIRGFFTIEKVEYRIISTIPKYGDKTGDVRTLQTAINEYLQHNTLVVDGDFGNKTRDAVSRIQKANDLPGSGVIGPKTLEILSLRVAVDDSKPITIPNSQTPPWVLEASKHLGKVETDPKFQEYMNPYWAKSGLPSFKGLVGASLAWCGLFGFMILYNTNYVTPKNSFRAKAWDGFGHAINWKTDGIPRGAFVRINSSGNCSAGSGNHITTANGYCTASDLTKSGATFGGLGGNQQNKVKVSIYKVSTICAVRWPSELQNGMKIVKPGPVKVSNNCTGSGPTNESTQ